MKNAIITGPTGAIGYALTSVLLDGGFQVTAIVRPGSENAALLPKNPALSVVECDLSNLLSLIGEIAPQDVFFHLGWTGTFGGSRNDAALQESNIDYSLEAVQLADSLHCQDFVFVGSQAEFGPTEERLSSSLPCRPVTEYGKAKLKAEELTKDLCESFGITFHGARFLSVYGPNDKPYTLISSTITKMKIGERLSFTKGDQIWNYLYSFDGAKALLAICEKGVPGKTYVVASDEEKPLREFITSLRNVFAEKELSVPSLFFGEIPYYENQVMSLCADISDLTKETGWKPETSFEEGIRSCL